jgi:hypothetical protein
VIHYLRRGVWDQEVPEPTEADRERIEGYQCNVCGKKFRNNHDKGEYPARGSFICHWATEHGKVVEVMRADRSVDMAAVLRLLEERQGKLAGFVADGTRTEHDKEPAKVIESIAWRIRQEGGRGEARVGRPAARLLPCPKCPDLDRNKDPNSLKLHIFHHYLDHWHDSVPEMLKKDVQCEQCSPAKRIVGANPEGCRTAMICHLAIQHGELRAVLRADPELPAGLLEDLYGEEVREPSPLLVSLCRWRASGSR